jgi:phosphonate transport system substrate-binding protein
MKTRRYLLFLVAGLLCLGLACGCAAEEAELGSEKNPIIWVFVPSGETARVSAGARSVAELLHEETDLYFDILVAADYAGAVEALCADPPKAQMSSLATFAYILAADRGCAEAAMLSARYGSPTYNGQILTRTDSGITSLADLDGKTFCRPDPLAISGWVIPSIMMRSEGVDPDNDLAEVIDAGSHKAVATLVFNGTCDAGATYVDARTRIQEDYGDVMDETMVITVEPAIPYTGVQFVPSLPEDLRQRIVDGLMALAETEKGQDALNTAYQWEELMVAGDESYDPFRQLLQASEVDIIDLVE